MDKNQSGYILALIPILITLVVSTGTLSHKWLQPQQLNHQLQQKHLDLLQQAKTNLLNYARAIPEIYATDTNGNFQPAADIPAPGFFPCPDTNNSGDTNTPCGAGQDIVIGRLPPGLATRHIGFAKGETIPFIWYVVDSRYVIQNADYHNPPTKRFAPLNIYSPGTGNITLGQQNNIIALLIISPESPPAPNTPIQPTALKNLIDIDQAIFEQHDALITSINLQEWQHLVYQRVSMQRSVLCNLNENEPHWFNACQNQQADEPNCPNQLTQQPDNPNGANWRTLLCHN